ncbi:uncharacterized protein [Pleurodeles waltl]|uniref:uncharacterized protein n=1 Tax=Pleurodeles waltl TaxID=8319 RepID=UPI0037093945
MESTGSRKVKCRWDTVPDVSPNKYIKYSDIPEPSYTLGRFQNGQDSPYQSENIVLKKLEEKPGTLDSSEAFSKAKSEMGNEHCAFPRRSAHSLVHHSVNAKPWCVNKTLTPLRKTLFPNQRYHSQPREVAHAQSKPSISEVKHGNVSCVNMDSSSSRLPKVVDKESVQETSSLERRRSTRSRSNQGCPELFMRALQDAIGNSNTSRVKTASVLGEECPPHQRIELSQPVSSSSRSFGYFSGGDQQEHENGQSRSSKLLTNNVSGSRTAGECQQTNLYSCPSSEDSHHVNIESYLESQDGNPLYSKSRNSDTYPSRKSRLNNTAGLRPRQSRHSDPAVYRMAKENRDIDRASDKVKNSITAVYPASRGDVYSNARDSTFRDTTDITSSNNNRGTGTTLYSTARKSLHNYTEIRTLRNNSCNDTDVCLSNENVCRSSIGLPSALDSMNSVTTVFQTSGLRDSNHCNSIVQSTSKDNLYSDYKSNPTASDRRHSGPDGYPSCKMSCSSSTNLYQTLGDSRPNNTERHLLSWESKYNDTTLHLTSVDISCADAVGCPPSKEFSPNDTAIYPRSRDRPLSSTETCQTSKEILHTKLETHKVPIVNSTHVEQQQHVCARRVDLHEEAPRLVFLHEHDSDDDEKKASTHGIKISKHYMCVLGRSIYTLMNSAKEVVPILQQDVQERFKELLQDSQVAAKQGRHLAVAGADSTAPRTPEPAPTSLEIERGNLHSFSPPPEVVDVILSAKQHSTETVYAAITSARRVSGLQAQSVKPLFTTFHATKVVLRTRAAFLPKVVTPLHLGQSITLLSFYPSPYPFKEEERMHRLDPKRALSFYVDGTKDFRTDDHLFVEQDHSWDGVCDRAVPITSSALVVTDVSDSSDTSFPRSRVAVGTLPDGGSRPLVAGETPEGFRAAAVKKGSGQKIGEREGEDGRRETRGERAGEEEEKRINTTLPEDEVLEEETVAREPQLRGHPRTGHDPGGSWLTKVRSFWDTKGTIQIKRALGKGPGKE